MSTETPGAVRPRHRWLPVVTGLALAAVFLTPLCAFQVRQTQVAIRKTFGKTFGAPLGPGLHFKLPWPVQSVDKFDTYLQLYQSGPEETYTRDSINLVVSLFVAWQLDDPVRFLENVGSPARAERILGSLLTSATAAVMAGHQLEDLVAVRAGDDRFAAVEDELLARVRPEAASKGIRIELVGIEQLAVDEKVSSSVLARMREERTTAANKLRLAGREEAVKIREQANEEARKILARAEAEAKRRRGEGEMAAAQYYKDFSQDPDFAIFLRKLEALVELTSRKTVLVIDRKVLPFDLLVPDAPAPPVVTPGGR